MIWTMIRMMPPKFTLHYEDFKLRSDPEDVMKELLACMPQRYASTAASAAQRRLPACLVVALLHAPGTMNYDASLRLEVPGATRIADPARISGSKRRLDHHSIDSVRPPTAKDASLLHHGAEISTVSAAASTESNCDAAIVSSTVKGSVQQLAMCGIAESNVDVVFVSSTSGAGSPPTASASGTDSDDEVVFVSSSADIVQSTLSKSAALSSAESSLVLPSPATVMPSALLIDDVATSDDTVSMPSLKPLSLPMSASAAIDAENVVPKSCCAYHDPLGVYECYAPRSDMGEGPVRSAVRSNDAAGIITAIQAGNCSEVACHVSLCC
jgi:hypothetical protein